MLPDRVSLFLTRLEEFIEINKEARVLFQDGLEEFAESAGAREIPEALSEIARGFATYDYRDMCGKNTVDLYLETHAAGMSKKEHSIWNDIAAATFSLYEVVSVRQGEGLTLCCLGQKKTINVVETMASRTIKPKNILACRIVRYRDLYEFTEMSILSDSQVYLLRRLLEISDQSKIDQILDELGDPRQLLKSHIQHEIKPSSYIDARLQMAAELPLLCPGATMEDVERRVKRMNRNLKSAELFEGLPFKSIEDLQRYIDLATQLYNWTPQEMLGGRSPAEVSGDSPETDLRKALAHDLMLKMATKEEVWSALSEDKRKEAKAAFMHQWEQTPQDELDGRTPAEVISDREIPVLPSESEWPPPDRPLMTMDEILEKLLHPLPAVRVWALRMLDYREYDPNVEKQVIGLISDPNDNVRLYARHWISEHADKVNPETFVDAVTRNEDRDSYQLLYNAAKWAPEGTVPLIENRLKSAKDSAKEPLLYHLLGRAGTNRAKNVLEKSSKDPSCFRRLSTVSGLYLLGSQGYLEATRVLAGVCLENRKTREKAWKKFRHSHENLWNSSKENLWNSWIKTLELLPVHFIQDELENITEEKIADVLHMHNVKKPDGFVELFDEEVCMAFRNAWSQRDLSSQMIVLLTDLLNTALEQSEGRDSPGFQELAERIHTLATALKTNARGLAFLPSRYVQSFLNHVMAVFLKACHGRLLSLEVEAAKNDWKALLKLNQQDVPFVLDELPVALAAHGASKIAGDLIEWIEDEDCHFGTVRAITTIAYLGSDPDLDRERAAAALVKARELDCDYVDGPLEYALSALGDVILRYLPYDMQEDDDLRPWYYAFIASKISTEGALFAIRHLLPYLRANVEMPELISSFMLLPHPSLLPVFEELCESMAEAKWAKKELEAFKVVCGVENHSVSD